MDEKTVIKALLNTDLETGNSLERTVKKLLKANFKLKLKKSKLFPNTELIRADIFVPTEEYGRNFYRYEIELFDGGVDNFVNNILNVKDKYPSYIVYLAESGGKRFLTNSDLNIVGEIYDKDVLESKFDTGNVLLRYCAVSDEVKYTLNPSNIIITSDLMKQLVKMFEFYAESYGISEVETVIKCIRYQYYELFLEKTQDEILNMDFIELDMTVRVYNCLSRYGVRTIGEMLSLTDKDFPHVRNLGKTSAEEAKQIQKDIVALLEFCKTKKSGNPSALS